MELQEMNQKLVATVDMLRGDVDAQKQINEDLQQQIEAHKHIDILYE